MLSDSPKRIAGYMQATVGIDETIGLELFADALLYLLLPLLSTGR